jgi:hypothetical protein
MTFYEKFLSDIVGKPVAFVSEVPITDSREVPYATTTMQYIFSFELTDSENTLFYLQESKINLATEIVREFGKYLLAVKKEDIANRGVIFFPANPNEITVMSGYSWEEIQDRSVKFWKREKPTGFVVMSDRAIEISKFIAVTLPDIAKRQNTELEFIIRIV